MKLVDFATSAVLDVEKATLIVTTAARQEETITPPRSALYVTRKLRLESQIPCYQNDQSGQSMYYN